MHLKFALYRLPADFKDRYIFTIDHTKDRRQKKMMKSISDGIGIKNVKTEKIDQDTWNLPNFDLFALDLWMKPSNMFKTVADLENDLDAQEEEEEQEEGDPEDPDYVPKTKKKSLKLKFDWWCQAGIPKNIAKLCKEFNEARNLKPNRIMLSGPPVSGLSFFAQKLSKFYNIPLVRIKDVIQAVEKLGEEDELAKEVIDALAEKKNELREAAQEQLDKKRSQGFNDVPDEPNEDEVSYELP